MSIETATATKSAKERNDYIRMKNSDERSGRKHSVAFKARTGVETRSQGMQNYRIIYTFNSEEGVIHLLAVGHRREIYRKL